MLSDIYKMKGCIDTIKIKTMAGSAQGLDPILGPKNLKVQEVTTVFNNKTKHLASEGEIYAKIFTYKGKFDILVNGLSTSDLIKKILKVTTLSQKPGKEIKYSLTMDQIKEIAQKKLTYNKYCSLDKMCKTIVGSMRSMGVELKG